MKKIGIILLLICTFILVSCTKDNDLKVSIANDVDIYSLAMSSVRGITLTPKVEGKTDKDIVYHWKIDNDTEKFQTSEGLKKEVINEGEAVLLVPGAKVEFDNSNNLTNTIKVTLTVEEKGNNNILSKDELIIEDYSGTYKVKK